MTCYFEKNSYAPGDTANIIADVDNSNSQLNINFMEAVLNKNITLVDNHGRTKHIHTVIARRRFDAIQAGEKRTGNNSVSASLNLVDNEH